MREEGYEISFCGTKWFIVEASQGRIKTLRDDEDDVDGYCDYDKQKIYVDESLHTHRKNLAVTHELLHVVLDRSGYQDNDETEEMIRRLEHTILELVKVYPEAYK